MEENKAELVVGDNHMHELSSTVSYSPSFSYYASGEFAATAAVQVSLENQSYNQSVKVDSVNDEDADDDFEFETSRPLHEDTFAHFPPFKNDVVFVVNKRDDHDFDAAPENTSGSFSGNCLWSPLRSSAVSTSTSKRCRLKNLLTKSHSDDASKTSSQAVKGKDNKTESYKVGEGDKRRKSYLPYRQDLIGVFAGIRGLRR